MLIFNITVLNKLIFNSKIKYKLFQNTTIQSKQIKKEHAEDSAIPSTNTSQDCFDSSFEAEMLHQNLCSKAVQVKTEPHVESESISLCNKGVQVNMKPRVRSKSVSCNIMKNTCEAICSPVKFPPLQISNPSDHSSSSRSKQLSRDISFVKYILRNF